MKRASSAILALSSNLRLCGVALLHLRGSFCGSTNLTQLSRFLEDR
jgi:hypothetical protein